MSEQADELWGFVEDGRCPRWNDVIWQIVPQATELSWAEVHILSGKTRMVGLRRMLILVKVARWSTQSFGHNTSTWQTHTHIHRQPRRDNSRPNALRTDRHGQEQYLLCRHSQRTGNYSQVNERGSGVGSKLKLRRFSCERGLDRDMHRTDCRTSGRNKKPEIEMKWIELSKASDKQGLSRRWKSETRTSGIQMNRIENRIGSSPLRIELQRSASK